MARVCISLPDDLINKLRESKPGHMVLSAHIRSLVYKGLEIDRIEQSAIKQIKQGLEAIGAVTTDD